MNIWTKKSFNLYNSIDYLDKLHDIYPMNKNQPRKLNPTTKEKITEYFNKKKDEELFKILINLEKFPIKDSYKAFFTNVPKKERNKIIEMNPKTIRRICQRIYQLGYNKMIEGIEEPIETNRQIGPMFENWINNQYPFYTDVLDFVNSIEHITSLKGSDDSLIKFAKEYLKLTLPTGRGGAEKGLDMIIKINTKPVQTYVIGEAKFITDNGGHQMSQLRDALDLITSDTFKNNGNFNVYRIAILDGICWIKSKNTKMQQQIRGLNDDEIALSALLLDSLFKSLK